MTTSAQREVIITGFGGQGIILTGNILGTAATIHDGRHATMTQSYGPEARGGSCSTQVIISDAEIAFPYAETPQVVICMSQEGYEKNAPALIPGGILIWDQDLVETGAQDPVWETYAVPATRFAEEMGNKMMANIVMLGFLTAVSDLVNADGLKQTMLSSVPPKTRDTNAAAFDRGRQFGLDERAKKAAK